MSGLGSEGGVVLDGRPLRSPPSKVDPEEWFLGLQRLAPPFLLFNVWTTDSPFSVVNFEGFPS